MATITDLVPPGVVTGDNLTTLLEHARANGYAIPAVNCTRYVDSRRSYPKIRREIEIPERLFDRLVERGPQIDRVARRAGFGLPSFVCA
jgi:hypothetical protein